MAERTASVKLTLRNEGFVAGLRQASKQAKDFSSSVADGAKKNKADLDTLGNGFAGVGLAAGAVVAIAVKKFADFDAAMSKVQAATHETAGNMAELREAALQAGADTAFSATEAAAAIENLAKAGVSTKDILGGGLNGALDLAAAGTIAVGDAAEIAATAMTQFGLSGQDVPHIADLLAAAAGKAQGEVSDMSMALKQGGLVAAQMGLSIEETTGTLAAFAAAGLLGSDAGTSFKTMLLKLANPSKEAAASMESLGIHAYDAQGAFIGIAPLAEQLKSKLSGLTQQQRDAALATIFGSDAIRAANVLYNNGAAGISDWTTKVNDSGYASETAAIKTDNLKGDIERLGGAIDTALIKTGEGANGALRALAQGAEAAVDGFSGLPDAVKQGALALTAVVAVTGLAGAGLLRVVTAVAAARTAFLALGRTGRALTLSLGAVGVVLVAATAVYGAFANRNAEAKQKADDLRATLDEQTGAITGNTRAYVANNLAESGLSEKAKDLGLSLSEVTDAALGNESAMSSLVRQLDAVIDAGTRSGYVGNSHKEVLTAEARAALQLKNDLTGTNAALTDAQQKQRNAAEGAEEHKTSQELQAVAVQKANEAIQAQVEDLNDQIDAMHRASTAALTLSGSQIAFEAALDDAAASIKENGRTLDINTEKGRANRTALNDVAAAANAQTDAMLKNGDSQTSVEAKVKASRTAFSALAQKLRLSKPEADALARSLIDIPPKKNVDVTVNTKTAKARADALAASIAAIKSKAVTITLQHIERGPKTGVGGREFEGRASGGGMNAGQPYRVGEFGPEIVIPGADSFVLTAAQTRQIDSGRFAQGMRSSSGVAPVSAQSGPTYLEAHIEIGGEVVRVVRSELKADHRALKRTVMAGGR